MTKRRIVTTALSAVLALGITAAPAAVAAAGAGASARPAGCC
jgi:hypothetical protein